VVLGARAVFPLSRQAKSSGAFHRAGLLNVKVDNMGLLGKIGKVSLQ
jgi:hypothetical protein